MYVILPFLIISFFLSFLLVDLPLPPEVSPYSKMG